MALNQRVELPLVSQSKQLMLKFSERESPLPKGSRKDLESWRKPLSARTSRTHTSGAAPINQECWKKDEGFRCGTFGATGGAGRGAGSGVQKMIRMGQSSTVSTPNLG